MTKPAPKKRVRTIQFVIEPSPVTIAAADLSGFTAAVAEFVPQYRVHPVVVIDDGELTPVAIEPITVAAADLATFAESYAHQIAEKEDEING